MRVLRTWLLLALVATAMRASLGADLSDARKLLQQGKYAEAEEIYRSLLDKEPAGAALGLAACQKSTGKREAAAETLSAGIKANPKAAVLHARLAQLAIDRGDLDAAAKAVLAAKTLDDEEPTAIWAEAQIATARGDVDSANKACERLVEFYNQNEIDDPDSLRAIGHGAAQFARWNRLSDQFRFLVNDFYPDLLTVAPDYWQAHLDTGRLFAEKYNGAEASRELKKALEMNPNSAEVHVALGQLALEDFEVAAAQTLCERALAINSQFLGAWQLKADIHLANFEPRAAAGVLSDALKLNPHDEATLGRLAAAYLSTDGLARTAADTRFGKLTAQVTAQNPHPGVFYENLGDALDRLRRWPAAAVYYQQATVALPQLISVPGKLGMALMRLAEEEQAKEVLDRAFEADPFNVRVNNTLKVLEVLDGYETHETEHFRIKFDPAKDRVLAKAMGRWLEEVYPGLVEQFGYAPKQKSLFEIFSKAKNTDGHGWFSARMVGLPSIHPIGACAGRIVAMQSPSEGQQRFDWSRVTKHEFVHLINLEQTDFNIPHWFTEALAVLNEGYPRPAEWNQVLVKSAAANKLFNLQNINLGFIRPHSSDEWTLAYCQAELYAEYTIDKYGPKAIAALLAAYKDNLTTSEALVRALGVTEPEFEKGYQAYVSKIVAELPKGQAAEATQTLAQLQRAAASNPQDAQAQARLALAQLDRKDYPAARRAADAALVIDPQSGLASYVRARLHMVVGEDREALARLEGALDRQRPEANLLALLAGLKLRSEDFKTAAELYELGARLEPGESKWQKSLANVYLKSGDEKQLALALEKLAEAEPDDLPVRKKLAQLARDRKDWPATARWSRDSLHFDALDAPMRSWRAEALVHGEKFDEAAAEYGMAIELEPANLTWHWELVQAHLKAGQRGEAKAALAELLKRDPQFDGAKALWETVK